MKNNTEYKSPIFIVGPPRSGTTLIRRCISRHSEIYIAPETRFFPLVYGERHLLGRPDSRKSLEFIFDRFFNQEYRIKDYSYLRHGLINSLENSGAGYKDIWSSLLSAIAEENGKERWGEKTPNHAFFLSHLLDLFPEACVVGMLRNPYAAITSYVKRQDLPSNPYTAIIKHKFSRKFIKKYSSEILIVKYKDLINNTEYEIKRTLDFINVNFEVKCMQPQCYTSSYDDSNGTKIRNTNEGIKNKGLDEWKNHIDSDVKHMIEKFIYKDRKISEIKNICYKMRLLYESARWLKAYLGIGSVHKKLAGTFW